jgi:hypothetical protein
MSWDYIVNYVIEHWTALIDWSLPVTSVKTPDNREISYEQYLIETGRYPKYPSDTGSSISWKVLLLGGIVLIGLYFVLKFVKLFKT